MTVFPQLLQETIAGATSFMFIERRLRVLAFEVLHLGTAILKPHSNWYLAYTDRCVR
jgi:hypothetical protein